MLEVTRINYIKMLREEKGLSISEISRKIEINWRTAKKYADGNFTTQEAPRRKKTSPIMGPYEVVIDLWLEEDVLSPVKQKITARNIYQRLCKLGFKGSERTVREYVKKRRKEIRKAWKEIYVRLEHDPGIAQADFGVFKAINEITRKIRNYSYLVLAFPFSNVALAAVLPSENMECFLTGLSMLFEQAGGAPREIWFDNLPSAVSKVFRSEERKLTSFFAEFQRYHRFKCKFCNVDAPNEKGHVENKVGYIRRNFFSPMPVIGDLKQFNEELRKKLEEDRERIHYRKKELISKLWCEDQSKLLKLPHEPMEIATTASKRVNKYGEIKLKEDNMPYLVPDASRDQNVFIKIYWDKLEFYDEYGEKFLGETPREYFQTQENMDWLQLLKIYRHKPRAIENGFYLDVLPQNIRSFILSENLNERRERMKTLISLLEDCPSIQAIDRAIEETLKYKRTDYGSIKNILSFLENSDDNSKKPKFEMDKDLTWHPDLNEYNGLLGEVNPHE